jgi:hypothetical protein
VRGSRLARRVAPGWLLPRHAFAGATEWVIWMAIAAYAVTFPLAFLLPNGARAGTGDF